MQAWGCDEPPTNRSWRRLCPQPEVAGGSTEARYSEAERRDAADQACRSLCRSGYDKFCGHCLLLQFRKVRRFFEARVDDVVYIGRRHTDGCIRRSIIHLDLAVFLEDGAAGEYHIADIADPLILFTRRQQR